MTAVAEKISRVQVSQSAPVIILDSDNGLAGVTGAVAIDTSGEFAGLGITISVVSVAAGRVELNVVSSITSILSTYGVRLTNATPTPIIISEAFKITRKEVLAARSLEEDGILVRVMRRLRRKLKDRVLENTRYLTDVDAIKNENGWLEIDPAQAPHLILDGPRMREIRNPWVMNERPKFTNTGSSDLVVNAGRAGAVTLPPGRMVAFRECRWYELSFDVEMYTTSTRQLANLCDNLIRFGAQNRWLFVPWFGEDLDLSYEDESDLLDKWLAGESILWDGFFVELLLTEQPVWNAKANLSNLRVATAGISLPNVPWLMDDVFGTGRTSLAAPTEIVPIPIPGTMDPETGLPEETPAPAAETSTLTGLRVERKGV